MRKVFLLFCFVAIVLFPVAIVWSGVYMTVEITDFPLGIGNSVTQEFIDQHDETFKWIADTMSQDPNLCIILIPYADATRYSKYHDPLNAATALSRAHLIKRILVERYGVDELRIFFADSRESSKKGPKERKVVISFFSIRDYAKKSDLRDFATKKDLDKYAKLSDLDELDKDIYNSIMDLEDSLASINKRISLLSKLRLGIGVGFSSAEKVDWITRFNASIDYGKIVYVIFNYDHSIFTREQWLPRQQGFGYEEIATWNRQFELLVAVFPTSKFPVGLFVGGGQYENLVQKDDTYTWRSRAVPFGLLLRGGPVMCRLSTDYGFSDNYNEREVKWGIGNLTAGISFNLYFGGGK